MEQADILVQQNPHNLSFQAQKAIEVMQNGDHEESIRLLENILEKAPLDPNTLQQGHLKNMIKTDAIKTIRQHTTQNMIMAKLISLANLKTYKFDDEEISQMKNQLKS